MDVAVTDITNCKKSLSIVIPADVAELEFQRRTQALAKVVRLPGFRPGKAPANLIKQRFYKELKGEVVHELVEARLPELIEGKGLNPISQPVVDKLDFELGSPLTLQVSFEVWPEINLSEYMGVTIHVKKSPEITEEEVSKVLEHYREEAATFVPVDDRAIQEADLISAHIVSTHTVSNKTILLHEEDATFTIGDSRVHRSFSENLTGLKPGDEKEFSIEYNNLYADKRLAGKTVLHKIRVLDVKAKQLPEINDDLAKDAGQYETLEQLKESIRTQLREKAQRSIEEEAKERMLDQLIEKAPFDVPDVLVQDRLQAMMYDLARVLSRQGIDVKHTEINWKKVAEEQKPRAVKEVQRSLVLDQIAKKEHIEILPAEVDMELSRIAKASSTSVEVVRATYQQKNRLEDVKSELRLKKALDFVYQHAKLINDPGGDI